MANSATHAGLPYPVRGARFTIPVPYLDATGTPTDPTTPDTEISKDGGAFADCTEEVTTIVGGNGSGYITLTGDEMDCALIHIAAKAASGPKTTLEWLYPRALPLLESATAQAGAAGTITLVSTASNIDGYYSGCIIRTTGGTGGGGGSGKLNNQARMVTSYNGTTKVATVSPNWETTPGADTTYEVLISESSLYLTRLDLNNIADAVLKRDWSQITGEASRSLLNAARLLRNARSVSDGVLSVKKEDGTTEAWRANVVGNPNAQPIVDVEPS